MHSTHERWKQRDIHEKREARKKRIAQFEAEIKSNAVLLPRLRQISNDLAEGGPAYYSQLVERLKTQPSPDKPTDAPNQLTYDAMIESLLLTVHKEVKEKGISATDTDKLGPVLVAQLDSHIEKLTKRNKEATEQLEEEKKEQTKKITSDDIHDGFNSKYMPPPKAPEPVEVLPSKKAPEKKTTTTIQTLNSPSAKTTEPPAPKKKDEENDSDSDDDTEIPDISPALLEFSKIPYGDFAASYAFIQKDRTIFVEGATDALLLQAFNAQMEGKSVYAKQCVHQSLLIQYCEKLGRDGVGMFFKRMMSGQQKAIDLFLNDAQGTYDLVVKRAKINLQEKARQEKVGGIETIQLVVEKPDTVISFNIPDGPPPETLILEGPGAEDLDVEEVRRSLQTRWEIYQGFDEKLKKALQSNSLEKVNKLLSKMTVVEAEEIVKLLQISGILHFAENGIRDETGKAAE
ncbi:uncharacterized protein EI90DRAFT_3127429 [Cantharellus anzutake]|uniref:uncharacterized protein n=1 Tax=Cantharellus anzutake TaxID=1750568 RepID=UPI001905935B|nr:uncharacterized protein EI90DRAFT_3127429 [Cantharellus anzutake]KAF8326983.1 hypothetical protein EI90DRAFT_3127429 [Cantharellus anzutake]